MKSEKDKKSSKIRTVTTVKAHYVGTESMATVFERALLIIHSHPFQQPNDLTDLKNNIND